jgi:hypothetical protein
MVFCEYYHPYLAATLSDSAIFVVRFRDFRCLIPRLSLSLSAILVVTFRDKSRPVRREKRAAPAPASTARLGEQYY